MPVIGSGTQLADRSVTIFDQFNRYPDGSLSGVTPLAGPAWSVTGMGVTVTSGLARSAASSGSGYLYAAGNPDILACDVIFTGNTTAKMMTMAWSSSATFDLGNLLHFNFGPHGFSCTVRQDAGSFDSLVVGDWENTLKADGVTVYRFAVAVDGNRLAIIGPNGNLAASVVDPRVALTRGNWVFWEPNWAGSDWANLVSATGYSLADATVGAAVHPAQLGQAAASLRPDRLVGSPAKRQEVSVGFDDTTKMPAVTFGPTTVTTRLSGAHAAGATSLTTEWQIPNSSTVQLESGANSETVTLSGGATGTGPYTHTLAAATTKAHPDGAAVIATADPSSRVSMYFNTDNSQFRFPNISAVILPYGRLYVGDSLDTRIDNWGEANCAGMAPGDSFGVDGTWNAGVFRLGNYRLWVDASGRLRIKSGAPTSDTDGTVVGVQA